MTDIDHYVADMKEHEGQTLWPYLDTVGRVTAGIGEMFESVWEFHKALWWIGDELATPEQVGAAWAILKAAKPGLRASAYEPMTSLRLLDPDRRCADLLIGTYLPGLRLDLPDFDARPLNCRRVLIDLAWNAGPRVLQKFPHLLHWLVAGDYKQAALQCHTKGDVHVDPATGEPAGRGVWRENTMASCAEVTT